MWRSRRLRRNIRRKASKKRVEITEKNVDE
jgi:hypothetical protein